MKKPRKTLAHMKKKNTGNQWHKNKVTGSVFSHKFPGQNVLWVGLLISTIDGIIRFISPGPESSHFYKLTFPNYVLKEKLHSPSALQETPGLLLKDAKIHNTSRSHFCIVLLFNRAGYHLTFFTTGAIRCLSFSRISKN